MTIEEAIKHAERVARANKSANCMECAEEHEQLADWLTELKQLRESFEKQKSINYELVDENQELINENAELKRLLRLAVEDLAFVYYEHECTSAYECDTFCPYNSGKENCCKGEWKHAEEALKLLGDDADD